MRIALTASSLLFAALLTGCAGTIDGASQRDPIGEGQAANPNGPDWAPVFESGRDARYRDQQVIYVDRKSLKEHQLEGGKYTYYTAITRQQYASSSSAVIQELAVLCEGAPIAPATSLRAEGSGNRDGSYKLTRAKEPITSLAQFSTQRIPIDPKVPSTFVVRAICMLGTDPHR